MGYGLSGMSQANTLTLFRSLPNQTDTSLYLTIQKDQMGVSFVFPLEQGEPYYISKNDSTLEKHHFPNTQSRYGPYKFKKIKGRILFQDKNINVQFRDLYEISTKEHFSPNLYSSSTDSYDILNMLLDSNCLLTIGSKKVPCFKFFQILSGHNSLLDKHYQILYVDKANLLPCRTESYADKDCKNLVQVVFMKSYTILR